MKVSDIMAGIGLLGILLGFVLSIVFYILGYGSYGEKSVVWAVIVFTFGSLPFLKKHFYGAAVAGWLFFEIVFRLFNPYWSYNSLTGRSPGYEEILEHLENREKFEARSVVYIRTHFFYADSYSYEEMLSDALTETQRKAILFFSGDSSKITLLKQNRDLNQELIAIENFAVVGFEKEKRIRDFIF